MKFVQPQLKINCDGLNLKLICELADDLCLHFAKVEVYDDTIYAGKPFSNFHYNAAWHTIEKFGVTVI